LCKVSNHFYYINTNWSFPESSVTTFNPRPVIRTLNLTNIIYTVYYIYSYECCKCFYEIQYVPVYISWEHVNILYGSRPYRTIDASLGLRQRTKDVMETTMDHYFQNKLWNTQYSDHNCRSLILKICLDKQMVDAWKETEREKETRLQSYTEKVIELHLICIKAVINKNKKLYSMSLFSVVSLMFCFVKWYI
jgi:hypothetical protein